MIKTESNFEFSASKTDKKLTLSQQQAFDNLKSFIDSNDKYFRLMGYAGTGKSLLMVKLMKHLQSKGINFVAAAPTNKASKNLQGLAAQEGLQVSCTTIAKLLGQQPELNKKSGKVEFITRGNISLDTYKVAILDEFSMISKRNFEEIKKAANKSETKIVFVGDKAQLPPVNEKEPIVATDSNIKQEALLTEVVRHDGEIVKVAEQIRNNPRYSSCVFPFSTTPDQSIVCLPRSEWLETAAEHFQTDEYRQNPDHCRILVWTNKKAEQLNGWIREKLWGKNPPSFVPGDRLIARKPVFRLQSNSSTRNNNKYAIVMNNSEECEVIDKPSLCSSKNYQFWSVPVQTDDGFKLTLRILTPESEKKRQHHLEELKKRKDWHRFYDLDQSYDYCAFAYALTTHKAQGSNIDYVFIDVADMKGSSDLQKLQYTALTRAKKQAFVPNDNSLTIPDLELWE